MKKSLFVLLLGVLLNTSVVMAAQDAACYVVSHPVASNIVIPEIARGNEEIYRQFYNGKLIYQPNPGNDEGRIEMPIAGLANPLEGMFDLSRCGDTGQYLSISTGYRKGKKVENASKYEIWLAPRFLIEKEHATTASHLADIMEVWGANDPVGIFCNYGGWVGLNGSWHNKVPVKNNDNPENLWDCILGANHAIAPREYVARISMFQFELR